MKPVKLAAVVLAAAMAVEVGRPVDYLAVPADGADRVAERLAELV